MKKYFIIAAAAALTLAACSKVTLDEEIANQEINFQVANYVAATKANAVYNEDIPFATSAWYYSSSTASAQTFMDEVTISCVAGTTTTPALNPDNYNKVWKAASAYYWPRVGSLNFVSFSPASMASKVTVSETEVSVTGYDVKNDINATATDLLMVADKVVGINNTTNADGGTIISGTNTNNFAGVPTLFRNTLAKLNFVIAADKGINATINTVTLSGLSKAGDIKLLPAGATNTESTGYKWAPAATEVTLSDASKKNVYVWDAKTAQAEGDYAYTETTTGEGAKTLKVATALDATELSKVACTEATDIIVLPQVLASQKITINADVIVTLPQKDGEGKDMTYSYNTNFEGLLLADAVPAWELNKIITYTITLKQGGEVTFDPAVAAWEEITSDADANEIKKN